MKTTLAPILAVLVILAAVAGCAPTVPRELADARTAYQRASAGPAAKLKPAELHKAKQALDKAEAAFRNSPKARRGRDLAYVAERKAQLAETLARTEAAEQKATTAEKDIKTSEHALAKRTQGELDQTRVQLEASGRRGQEQAAVLGAEQQARKTAEARSMDAREATAKADQRAVDANDMSRAANERTLVAETRAKSAEEALTKLAMVRDEPRGRVITLSGSVLFGSDQSTLLPAADMKLASVADALLNTRERKIIVEGHTDSRGSTMHNMVLSQRRADAVRNFLVARGYEPDLIRAHGIGEDRPVTSNGNAEGRANNRRVEIIVEPSED